MMVHPNAITTKCKTCSIPSSIPAVAALGRAVVYHRNFDNASFAIADDNDDSHGQLQPSPVTEIQFLTSIAAESAGAPLTNCTKS
jgi:hypothetical protein